MKNTKPEEMLDMNKPITIICPEHGEFQLTPNDHLGYNKERIAYGCPHCKDGDKHLD